MAQQLPGAIEVCYEDRHLAIIWKPYGMSAINTGRAELNVEAALPHLFRSAAPAAEAPGADCRCCFAYLIALCCVDAGFVCCCGCCDYFCSVLL